MALKAFQDGTYIDVPDDPQVNDTFTISTTGFSGTAPSGTAKYQKIGNMVILNIPALSGTSNSTAFTLTGLPAHIRPSSAKSAGMVPVTNAGAQTQGACTVNTDGTITLASGGLLGALFSALLGKGISAVDISYLV